MNFQNWHIHTSYIVVAAILSIAAYVGVHSWIAEHDARLLAEQKEKISEQAIKGLQDQIKANNDQIATLQKSIDDVNKAAQRKIDVIVKQQEQVKTPAQAIAAIDSVSTRPLDARTVDGEPDRTSVVALPLFQELSDCRITDTKLDACTKNLGLETQIAQKNDDNYQKQVAITGEKQKEIDALKKPKKFWSRVGGTMKQIGIGIGIGLGLGKVL